MAIDVTAGKGVGTQAMNLADQRRREVFENQGITMGDITLEGRKRLGTVDTETFVPPIEKDVYDFIREEEDAAIRKDLQENTALTPAPVRPENMEELARQQEEAEINEAQRKAEMVPAISRVLLEGQEGNKNWDDLQIEIDKGLSAVDTSSPEAINNLNRTDPMLGAFWRAHRMANHYIPGSTLSTLQAATLLANSYRGATGEVVPNWDAALTADDRTKVLRSRDEKFKGAKEEDYSSEEFQTALRDIELDKKISTKDDATKGQEVDTSPDAPIFKGSRLNTNNTNIIFHTDLLDAGLESKNKLGEPTLIIDPKFKEVMSLATEAFLMEAMFTADDADTVVTDADEGGFTSKAIKLTASKGSNRLGRDIFQAWKRQQAQDLGIPTDSYLDTYENLSSSIFTHIGNMAKRYYSSVNPLLFENTGREVGGKAASDKFLQTEYQLTQKGIDVFTHLHRANWGLFNNQEVKPLMAPSGTGLFMFEGRTRVKNITTQIPGRPKGERKLLNEARRNMNSVAMVTDQRRLSTALMFGMLALVNSGRIIEGQYTPQAATKLTGKEYTNIFKIGEKAFKDMQTQKQMLFFKGERAIRNKEKAKGEGLLKLAESYDPEHILELEREKFISILEAAGRYSTSPNGNAIPNHLTFAIQALTGRMHAQQTLFNPQAHKIIRFIVGGKNKYQWKPGDNSKLDKNWKEGISAKLFEGRFKQKYGFKRTRDKRIKVFDELAANPALDSEYNQKVQWGKSLQALVSGFDTKRAREQLTAFKSVKTIEQGQDLKRDMFQSIVDKDPIKDPALKEFLAGEEEEAIIMADYLMDLAAYDTAKKNNTLHNSTVIFEADGITHGPSTMAMLLGSAGIAKRAGVLMDQDFSVMTDSTDYQDLRDHMAWIMKKSFEKVSTALGVSQNKEAYEEILLEAIDDRQNFLKQSPMTMGYGQELASLIDHIDTTIFLNQKIRDIINEKLNGNIDAAADFLHSILVESIYQTFDHDTINASKLIKNNGYASALSDIDITINAPAGNALNILGGESTQLFQTTFNDIKLNANFEPKFKKEKIKIGVDENGKPIYQRDSQGNFVYRTTNTYEQDQITVTHYGEKYSPSAPRTQGGMEILGGWTTGRLLPALVQPYDANMVARTLSGKSWERIIAESTGEGNKDPFVLPIFDAFLVDLGSMDAVIEEANKHHIDSIRDHSYVEKIVDNWYSNWKKTINALPDNKPLKQIIFEGSEEGYSWAEAKRGLGPFRMLAKMTNQRDLQQMFARTKDYKLENYSIKEWKNKAWRQGGIDAKIALDEISKRGVKLTEDEITGKDLKIILDVIVNSKIGLNLEEANRELAKVTAKRRSDLLAMVDEQIAKGILTKNINI